MAAQVNRLERSLPAVQVAKKAACCVRFSNFFKRIWEVIKWIFQSLGKLCYKPKMELSQRELTLIQSNTARQRAEIKLGKVKKRPIQPVAEHIPAVSSQERSETKLKLPKIDDPLLADFFKAGQELFLNMSEALYQEKVLPNIAEMEKGIEKAPDILKLIADIAVRVGDKAVKPLFEKLNIIKEKVSPDLLHALKWLLKGWQQDDFSKQLDQALDKNLKNEPKKDLFIDQFTKWLFEGTGEETAYHWMENIFPTNQYENAIDEAFEAALVLLIDKKINMFVAQMHAKLDNKFSQLLHTALQATVERISGILLHRFVLLIENLPYTSLFDELLQAALDHSETLIELESIKPKFHQQKQTTIANLKRAAASSKTDEQDRNQINSFLESIDDEDSWIEKEAENETLAHFAKKNVCYPQIKSLIENPNLIASEKQKLTEDLFDAGAAKLIPLLLPPQQIALPNGKVKEVDALLFLISQFTLPSEFKELVQDALEIFKGIISEDTQKLIKSVNDKIIEIAYGKLEEIILEEARKYMQKGIKLGLRLLMDDLLSKTSFDDLMLKQGLPNLQDVLLRSLGLHVIGENSAPFAPLFYAWSGKNGEKAGLDIAEQLFKKVKVYCREYSIERMTLVEFSKIVNPLLVEIRDGVLTHQKLKKDKSIKLTEEAIQGYLTTVYEGRIPSYNILLHNLVFKIGKLGSTLNWFSGFFQGTLDDELTAAVHPYRKSSDLFIDLATKKFRELSPEQWKELLFPKVQPAIDPKPEAERILEVSLHLNDELKKTARIVYDLIIAKAGGGIKVFLGTDASHLEQVIQSIYETVLRRDLVTHNFLVQTQNIAIQKLAESAAKISSSRPLDPWEVKSMPTLIPEPLNGLIFSSNNI